MLDFVLFILNESMKSQNIFIKQSSKIELAHLVWPIMWSPENTFIVLFPLKIRKWEIRNCAISKLEHFVVILWHLILVDMADELGEEPKDEKALELCKAALKYLHQCSGILGSMYNMPACPIFHTSHRSVFCNTSYVEIFLVEGCFCIFKYKWHFFLLFKSENVDFLFLHDFCTFASVSYIWLRGYFSLTQIYVWVLKFNLKKECDL